MNNQKNSDNYELPFYYKILTFIFGWMPNPSSVYGIVFYGTAFYILFIIGLLLSKYFGKEEDAEIKKEDKAFEARLAEYRKARDIEARKILKAYY
jgi:hypothetical protein